MARRGSPSETSPTGTSPIAALLASFRTDGGGATIAAVFDFADTLIDGACGSMIDEQRRFGVRGGPAALARIVGAVIDSAAREQRVAAHLEQWVGRWAGRTEDDLAEVSERLFSHDCGGAAARLSHEAWRLVKAHQRAGHTVVIATSATRAQVAPLARELGVEHVLCTELGVRDGVLTGAVAGQVLQGLVKAARVWSFMTEHDIDAAASHAYTHSEQDVALLDGVGHPHPVNPSPALAAVASARGWPVLTFRSYRTPRHGRGGGPGAGQDRRLEPRRDRPARTCPTRPVSRDYGAVTRPTPPFPPVSLDNHSHHQISPPERPAGSRQR